MRVCRQLLTRISQGTFVAFGALVVASIATGCQKPAQEEKPPEQAAPVRRNTTPVAINYENVLGVARKSGGVICVAMPAALDQGDALTLVNVPLARVQGEFTQTDFSHVVNSRVMGSGSQACTAKGFGTGLRLPGDSVYVVATQRDTVSSAVYFAVALPYNTFFRVGHTAGARLGGTTEVLNFRICASTEGLHLTAWEGSPLSGKRVWHRYFFMGYDQVSTCVEKDIVG
jgi:hypothetical protein